MSNSNEILKQVINDRHLNVGTFSVASDDAHKYFKDVTGKFAGNLFCDIIYRDIKGVSQSVGQVYYDPQYDESIIIKSGANLVKYLHSPEDLKVAEKNETIKFCPTVEETEVELIHFLETMKDTSSRIAG